MAKGRRRQSNRTAKAPVNTTASASPGGSTPLPTTTAPRPAPDPRAAERIQRQRERAEARRRHERQRRIRTALIALAAVVLVGAGIVWFIQSRGVGSPPPGQTVAIVSPFTHVPDGQKVTTYNTVPPTSGPHYANSAQAGVHTQPIPNEVQVHNLEHGQIIIQYTCDCPELAEQLKVFAQRYGNKWVLVAPYPDATVGARIALTAWGAIDKFDEFDEARITRFIEYYKNKGPERVFTD